MAWLGISSWWQNTSTPPDENGFFIDNTDQNVIKYEDKGLLGSGGFGSVHKVEKVGTNEIFALKIIETSIESKEKVETEALLMKKLTHQNITQIHSHFWKEVGSKLRLFIVMEFARGKDLAQYLSERDVPIPFSRSVRYIIKLLETIQSMHNENITHRDLKLENILCFLDEKNCLSLKIADFGLAVQLTRYSQTMKGYAGTRCYMAPEYFDKTPDIIKKKAQSCKVDVFAAGLIVYAILTKDMGFLHYSGYNGWFEYIKQNPTLLQDKVENDGMRFLLERMLEKDPKERWNIEEIINSDFVVAVKAIQGRQPLNSYSPHAITYLASMIDRNTPKARLNYILRRINNAMKKSSEFGDSILLYGLVPRLCALMKDYHEFIEIHRLLECFLYSQHKHKVVAQLFGANLIEELLELFKNRTPIINLIFAQICTVPYASYVLQVNYGFHHILSSFLDSGGNDFDYVEIVFQSLCCHSQSLISSFLDHRPKQLVLSQESTLFWLCNNANELLFTDTAVQWKSILEGMNKDPGTCDLLFCSCLIRMIIPLHSLFVFAKNIGWNVTQLGFPEANHFTQEELLELNRAEWISPSMTAPPLSFRLPKAMLYEKSSPFLVKDFYSVQRDAFSTFRIRDTGTVASKRVIKDRYKVIESGNDVNEVPFYFEVRIDSCPSSVSIGLTTNHASKTGFSDHDHGDQLGEYGYHNQYGNVYLSCSQPLPYGRPFGVGDTVGCGISPTGALFYTLNGVYLGETDYTFDLSGGPLPVFAALGCNGDSGAEFTFFYEKNSFLFAPTSHLDSSITWNRTAVESLLKAEIVSQISTLCSPDKKNPMQVAILMKSLEITNPGWYESVIKAFPVLANNPPLPNVYQMLFSLKE